MARLEPLTMLSALAVNTKRIVLAAAASLEEAKALWKELNTLVDIENSLRQLNLFVERVIPELRRRGLFRDEYEFGTLRENLGLPVAGY